MDKIYHPVSCYSVVSKICKNVNNVNNNRLVDHLKKYGFLSDFQYGFRSSRSTADLVTVVQELIASASNKSGATQGFQQGAGCWSSS